MTEKAQGPCWRYGPNGEAHIFDSPSDAPKGWKDTPAAFEKGKKSSGSGNKKTPGPNSKIPGFDVTRKEALEALDEGGVDMPEDATNKDIAVALEEHLSDDSDQ